MVLHVFLFFVLAFWVGVVVSGLSLEGIMKEWFSFGFLLSFFYTGIPLFLVIFMSYCRVFFNGWTSRFNAISAYFLCCYFFFFIMIFIHQAGYVITTVFVVIHICSMICLWAESKKAGFSN